MCLINIQVGHGMSGPWRHEIDLEGLSLARGVQLAQAGQRAREPLAAGDIKIVFLLEGALHWGAAGTPLMPAWPGSVNVCFGPSGFDIENVYGEARSLRYCGVRLSAQYLQATSGLDAHALVRRWRHAAHHPRPLAPARVAGDWSENTAVLSRAMSADEWRWASAMASQANGECDGADPAWQRLALVAQTFDALARCAAYIPGALDAPDVSQDAPASVAREGATAHRPSGALAPTASQSHRARVTRRAVLAARDVLDARLQAPPSLPELAREVGINVNKLCAGFREHLGVSVQGYVRERRLTMAYELLSARRISVGEAAWRCGYTDSHFAKVFRARFGMLPNVLSREGADTAWP
ncbi:AraC family transcriptional regulator [Pandoraea nosoerga]|uniref:AraC family transcriptional regulator n=2 Tax=Pandoraea nosoerga TaxID=2508296 RepID=A0A5E4TNQ8_9BURK|nr:AraC family transcriptional regulator [Pandoraea nosoerga]